MNLDPNTLVDDGSGNLTTSSTLSAYIDIDTTAFNSKLGPLANKLQLALDILDDANTPEKETIPLSPTFGDKYVDMSFVPMGIDTVQLYILDVSGEQSPLQNQGTEYTVVRDSIGGDFKRIAWDSTSSSGSAAIPDSDPAPSSGMQDTLLSSDSFLIYYSKR
jgi:hypothetical protein